MYCGKKWLGGIYPNCTEFEIKQGYQKVWISWYALNEYVVFLSTYTAALYFFLLHTHNVTYRGIKIPTMLWLWSFFYFLAVQQIKKKKTAHKCSKAPGL